MLLRLPRAAPTECTASLVRESGRFPTDALPAEARATDAEQAEAAVVVEPWVPETEAVEITSERICFASGECGVRRHRDAE